MLVKTRDCALHNIDYGKRRGHACQKNHYQKKGPDLRGIKVESSDTTHMSM